MITTSSSDPTGKLDPADENLANAEEVMGHA